MFNQCNLERYSYIGQWTPRSLGYVQIARASSLFGVNKGLKLENKHLLSSAIDSIDVVTGNCHNNKQRRGLMKCDRTKRNTAADFAQLPT